MTGQEVFATAASFLTQSVEDSEDLMPFVVGWLNVLIAESVDAENALLRAENEEELETPPMIGDLTEDIPLHENIARTALAYGLASQFFMDDDNDYRAQDFRARFVNTLHDVSTHAVSEKVVDVYA